METGTLRHRRYFLGDLVGAAALTVLLETPARAADDAGNIMVEWTQHMFSSDLGRFPINPKYLSYQPTAAETGERQDGRGARANTQASNPQAQAPFTADELAERARRLASRYPNDPLPPYLQNLQSRGIDRAVFVAPEPYGDDPTLVLDCLRRTPADRFKGTSLFYPRDADSPRKLAALVKREPRIVSTRFHKIQGNSRYMESFADPGVRALWKQAADLGLVIELHIGPQFGIQVAEAIAAVPGSKVLIDHIAEPQTGNAIDYGSILDLAKLPNVYIKLSELNTMAKDPPYFESLLPLTSRIIKEYGPDRIVWSGGSPRIAEVHMKGYSQADVAKVRGGNLRRLLNW